MTTQLATFAAGCFWGVEKAFCTLPGVTSTTVGYTGGTTDNPTYKQVCSGSTNHAEAVNIEFDQDQISYTELLERFWKIHNPTQKNRQGNDIGTQYRSAIFYHSEKQKLWAKSSQIEEQEKYKTPIVTQILKASKFYAAEESHQQYLLKNPGGYCHINFISIYKGLE